MSRCERKDKAGPAPRLLRLKKSGVARSAGRRASGPSVASLLAHEAQHIVGAVLGGTCGARAYALQYVLDSLISDYMESGRRQASCSAWPEVWPEKMGALP